MRACPSFASLHNWSLTQSRFGLSRPTIVSALLFAMPRSTSSKVHFVDVNQTEQDHIRQLVAQAQYAHAARPSVNSPHRAQWKAKFLDTMKRLEKSLKTVKLPDCPPMVLGIIYARNLAILHTSHSDNMNIEEIKPALDNGKHPLLALDRDLRRLPYTPKIDGIVGLLPIERVHEPWWLDFGVLDYISVSFVETLTLALDDS